MKKFLFVLILCLIVSACSNKSEEKEVVNMEKEKITENESGKEETIIESKDGKAEKEIKVLKPCDIIIGNTDDNNYKDLVDAASYIRVKAVERLLKKEKSNAKKNSALIEASKHENLSRMDFFDAISEGEDEEECDREPTVEQMKKDYTKIAKLLIASGADVNAKDEDKKTPLYYAALNGNTDMVKVLLESGAEVNAKDEGGRTAYIIACDRGNIETANVLLKAGAVDSLPMAAARGDLDAVKAFIAKGVNINTREKNYDQDTALTFASNLGHTEIVKYLIEKGADINLADAKGRTPLWYASGVDNIENIKLLLAAGADVNKSPKNGETAIIRAACNGQTETIKLLLAKKANINDKTDENITPLMCAAMYDKAETINFLVANKANINQREEWGYTALMLAAKQGKANAVKALIEAGADLNIQDHDRGYEGCKGYTALMYAVEKEHNDIVKILIDAGANINIENKSGRNALYCAYEKYNKDAMKLLLAAGANPNTIYDSWHQQPLLFNTIYDNQPDIAKLLIDAGADVNFKDKDGNRPLTLAINRNAIITEMLLNAKGIEVTVQEPYYERDTPLIDAAYNGEAKLVKLLIAKGAAVDAKNGRGETALMQTAWHESTDIAEMLLKAGANVNIKSNTGRTAIVIASNAKMLKLLLEAGAEVNVQDEYGYTALNNAVTKKEATTMITMLLKAGAKINQGNPTPLMKAAEEGEADIIKLLIASGANVNAYNDYGDTALIYAVRANKIESVKVLLDAGANPNLSNKGGVSAVTIAANNGYKEISQLFVKSGKVEDTLLTASLRGDVKAVKEFIKKGANVNEKDNNGFTILMLTARQNNPEIIKLLLDAGADMNAVSGEATFDGKYTALALAAGNNQVENIKLLLAAGAKVNVKDLRQNTPLHYAANNEEMTKMLLAAGADVNAKGEDENTPLMMAAKAGNVKVAKLLLEAGADVNIADDHGDRPLDIYYVRDNKEMKELLEKYKKDTLQDACNRLDVDAVKNLIKAGADVNAVQRRTVMVPCGPACDGYKIVEYSLLHQMLGSLASIKERKEEYTKKLKEERADALLTKEEWLAKYGADCLVCEDPKPEYYEELLKEEDKTEKKVSQIVELLKAAGAKDIPEPTPVNKNAVKPDTVKPGTFGPASGDSEPLRFGGTGFPAEEIKAIKAVRNLGPLGGDDDIQGPNEVDGSLTKRKDE